MIKTLVYCDFCEKSIPYSIRAGEEDCSIDIELYKTKEFDTHDKFPHLCETCAKKLDDILLAYRADLVYRSELGAKFSKANAERKERLGTKG